MNDPASGSSGRSYGGRVIHGLVAIIPSGDRNVLEGILPRKNDGLSVPGENMLDCDQHRERFGSAPIISVKRRVRRVAQAVDVKLLVEWMAGGY